jgi:hypothetical protein
MPIDPFRAGAAEIGIVGRVTHDVALAWTGNFRKLTGVLGIQGLGLLILINIREENIQTIPCTFNSETLGGPVYNGFSNDVIV